MPWQVVKLHQLRQPVCKPNCLLPVELGCLSHYTGGECTPVHGRLQDLGVHAVQAVALGQACEEQSMAVLLAVTAHRAF